MPLAAAVASPWRGDSYYPFLLCRTVISVSMLLFFSGGGLAVNDQGEALLSWKRSLNGSLSAMSNWNPGDLTPCRWFGVTCDATNRVVELSLKYVDLLGNVPSNYTSLGSLRRLVLSGTNLSGGVPPTLGDLPGLAYLDLSDNALTGEIPGELCRPSSKLERLLLNSNRLEGSIPAVIGNLSALRWLILYDNQLDGEIPPTIGQLGSLEVIRAGGNKNLHGPLPPEIGNCSSLRMIGLAETSISGFLPPTLGQLKKLQTLAVYTALLSGQIPPQLGDCDQLENIYLYENTLSGSIPSQLGNLGKLKNLLLWQNTLVGVIPPELGACAELAVVDLSMNALTGAIPPTLGNLSSLQELQLSVNQLSGPIPVELAGCSNLTDLELDNNALTGAIPAELGRLGGLRLLYLWQNKLEGVIPPEIATCTELEALDLSQNGLTGPIPKGIFRLPQLNKLLLLSNNLAGEIPPEIGNCSALIRFRANGNRIAGRIPPEIGLLKNLTFLDLGANRIDGALPAEIAGCRNLTFLDLHFNRITGALPDTFATLVSLQFVDLSGNSLGGVLDPGLGGLASLTKLILAGNQFSGGIPSEIASCARLQLLDLSGNGFSGEIPAELGKIPALEIALNLSWNALSGAIPAEFSGLARLGVLDLSHNRLTGDLRPLAALQNLVVLNVSYNNLSGAIPSTGFFSKLPISDLEGNPALCLSRCSPGSGDGDDAHVATRRAVRVATAVLLSLACVLLAAAALVFLGKRRGGKACDDVAVEDDVELGPPWEVTLYQKMDICVAEVVRCLTPANEVGKGWSGRVFRSTVPSCGATIAVKRFRACDDMAAAAFACEIGTLGRVRHRNIVRLLGWAANHKTRLLFYDYLPNGSLGALLHSGGAAPTLEWETRLEIAVGVAEGLSYLHHDCVPGILHRDVKADNVLLGERYEPCIADFGLSRVVDDDGKDGSPDAPHLVGSYGYIAPEYGCMRRVTRKSDVYSYGVVLLELITGRRAAGDPGFEEGQGVVAWVKDHLRQKRSLAEVIDQRLQGRPDSQVQEMLQALGIALLCASTRAEDRPTMKDVAALLRGIQQDSAPAGGSAHKGTSEPWKRAQQGGAPTCLSSGPSPAVASPRGPPQASLAYSSASATHSGRSP